MRCRDPGPESATTVSTVPLIKKDKDQVIRAWLRDGLGHGNPPHLDMRNVVPPLRSRVSPKHVDPVRTWPDLRQSSGLGNTARKLPRGLDRSRFIGLNSGPEPRRLARHGPRTVGPAVRHDRPLGLLPTRLPESIHGHGP
jgi:hypothetical protein